MSGRVTKYSSGRTFAIPQKAAPRQHRGIEARDLTVLPQFARFAELLLWSARQPSPLELSRAGTQLVEKLDSGDRGYDQEDQRHSERGADGVKVCVR